MQVDRVMTDWCNDQRWHGRATEKLLDVVFQRLFL